MALAQEYKCLFFECSAKTSTNVQQCFQELISTMLEVPSLLEKGSTAVKKQTKDQIGTFTYFPSINFQKVAGGYGPIRVNNRVVIAVPFGKPEAELDLLIDDWEDVSLQDFKCRDVFQFQLQDSKSSNADYYTVATPKLLNTNDSSPLVAEGLLHYANSATTVTGPLPSGPNPYDIDFSVEQATSISAALIVNVSSNAVSPLFCCCVAQTLSSLP
ncbi:hypothetical protein ACH5RR_018927 [Cinchona calisaya]|uniref:Plastocyanin-like domain-containing protein n=1 Tax=Cinchona calisaya TaxID=153742 RepID=A0ABD2ZP42_9GENT